MKRYSWIISLLLALSVVIWPIFAIYEHFNKIENLYKDSASVSRTVELCGTATISQVPVGKPNIGWNEFCGLIEKSSLVSYYVELSQDNRSIVKIQALARTSTGFVLITRTEIKISTLEAVASFGLKDNSVFYTTEQVHGMVETTWVFVFVLFMLVWGFLNWIVSSILRKIEKEIYLRHANEERKPKAKGGAGIA